MTAAPIRARVSHYLAWVFVCSLPFYLWGVVSPVGGLPFGLPATAIMVIVPAAVATALTGKDEAASGVADLWRRVGDAGRVTPWRWWLLAVAIMPIATIIAYLAMRALDRPLPRWEPVSGDQVLLAFGVFAAGAVFEEVGWTGYATPALQRRYGVFKAGCMLGAAWALWHVVPWWLHQGHTADWVIAQGLASVAMRVIMVWIYARGGRSLLLAILFHATINTTYSLFPNGGSSYDPSVMAWVLWLGIGAVGLASISETRRRA